MLDISCHESSADITSHTTHCFTLMLFCLFHVNVSYQSVTLIRFCFPRDLIHEAFYFDIEIGFVRDPVILHNHVLCRIYSASEHACAFALTMLTTTGKGCSQPLHEYHFLFVYVITHKACTATSFFISCADVCVTSQTDLPKIGAVTRSSTFEGRL